MFIDSSYLFGCNLATYSISNGFGILLKKLVHFSFIISSILLPTPPRDLGNKDKTVEHKLLVSLIAAEISALACKP